MWRPCFWDHFRQAGEVVHSKIMTEGPGGRSKGCGIIEMSSVDEAGAYTRPLLSST